jgi:hypothetical protein
MLPRHVRVTRRAAAAHLAAARAGRLSAPGVLVMAGYALALMAAGIVQTRRHDVS